MVLALRAEFSNENVFIDIPVKDSNPKHLSNTVCKLNSLIVNYACDKRFSINYELQRQKYQG